MFAILLKATKESVVEARCGINRWKIFCSLPGNINSTIVNDFYFSMESRGATIFEPISTLLESILSAPSWNPSYQHLVGIRLISTTPTWNFSSFTRANFLHRSCSSVWLYALLTDLCPYQDLDDYYMTATDNAVVFFFGNSYLLQNCKLIFIATAECRRHFCENRQLIVSTLKSVHGPIPKMFLGILQKLKP